MRSLRSMFSLVLCVFVLVSCYKNKPRKGVYKAQFCYKLNGSVKTYPCEIYESKKGWVYLGISYDGGFSYFKDTLFKNKDKVTGYFNFSTTNLNSPYKAEGVISRDGNGFDFIITGIIMYAGMVDGVEITSPAGEFKIYKD